MLIVVFVLECDTARDNCQSVSLLDIFSLSLSVCMWQLEWINDYLSFTWVWLERDKERKSTVQFSNNHHCNSKHWHIEFKCVHKMTALLKHYIPISQSVMLRNDYCHFVTEMVICFRFSMWVPSLHKPLCHVLWSHGK